MKSKIYLFSIILIFIFYAVNSSYGDQWEKTFGGSGYDFAMSAEQTADGGYIITGGTGSYLNPDLYLIKTDASGNQQWSKTFGTSSEDYGEKVRQTTDGGYIVTGYYWSFDPTDWYIWLMKTDANGNQLWSKTFERGWEEDVESLEQTTDGGYIIGGDVDPFDTESKQVWVIKTDANGKEQWSKTFGGGSIEYYGGFVKQTAEGGYIIAATIYSSTLYGAVRLTKTDANGNELWSKTFGTEDYWTQSVQQTKDGGYVIAGSLYGYPGYLIFLIKTDANGNQLWRKTFAASGSISEGGFVQQTTDGGYIVLWNSINESYIYNIYLIKTNASGNQQWSKTFGGSNNDFGYSVEQTTDGGYIISGETWSFGAGNNDVYLIYYNKNSLPKTRAMPWIPLLLDD